MPQNVLGLLFLLLWGQRPARPFHGALAAEYRCRWLKEGTCFSLGMFIFLGKIPDRERKKLLAHEYGHTVQSLLFGPLYLLLIFLPSVFWFIRYHRDPARWRTRGVRYSDRWMERNANFWGHRITGKAPMDW